VGINLATGSPSARQIHAAIRATLTDPRYRRNAQALRDDFARHNALDRIAALVEDIVGATPAPLRADRVESLT
jgi:UDP:flavonoid glycosyltransferase YjiC (YdhE family)